MSALAAICRAWVTVARTDTYRITTVTNAEKRPNCTNLKASSFVSDAFGEDWRV